MVEIWFAVKVLSAIIFAGVVIAVLAFIVVSNLFDYLTFTRKMKWLKKHGFSKVTSAGCTTLCIWKNEKSGKQISEGTIRNITYKSLVKQMANSRLNKESKKRRNK